MSEIRSYDQLAIEYEAYEETLRKNKLRKKLMSCMSTERYEEYMFEIYCDENNIYDNPTEEQMDAFEVWLEANYGKYCDTIYDD